MLISFIFSFSESILSDYDSEPTYHPSVGELLYPESSLALADRTQKAGLVDVRAVQIQLYYDFGHNIL